MRQRETRLASAAILALAAACAPSAQAAYVVTFQEVGANVVESGGGTVDETDLKINNTDDSGFAFLTPSDGAFLSGSGAPAVFDVFIDITGPGVFGPGDVDVPNSSSGDAVGIQMGFFRLYFSSSRLHLRLAAVRNFNLPTRKLLHDQYRRERGSRALDLGDDNSRLRRSWLCFDLSQRRSAGNLRIDGPAIFLTRVAR